MSLKHTLGAIEPLRALREDQPERFGVKVKRTILGLLFAGLGAFILVKQVTSSPSTLLVAVSVGLLILGATVWSTELVAVPLKLVLGAFKDVIAAIKNGRA